VKRGSDRTGIKYLLPCMLCKSWRRRDPNLLKLFFEAGNCQMNHVWCARLLDAAPREQRPDCAGVQSDASHSATAGMSACGLRRSFQTRRIMRISPSRAMHLQWLRPSTPSSMRTMVDTSLSPPKCGWPHGSSVVRPRSMRGPPPIAMRA
jgi:hypothetical protein